jgi:deoxyribodipyrimidine photo-lyase
MTDTAIVWFRRDLRVHDHPSLTAAARGAERVVPVFVLDEALLDGRFASGPRIRFLLGCLRELREALRERGADLVVRAGDPVRELATLARETGAEELHFASDVSGFAMSRDRRVSAAMEDAGVKIVRHPGLFVADVGKPRTKGGKPYAVFSPFWRAWAQLERRDVHGAPRTLALPPGVRAGEIPPADALGLPGDVPDPFPPGERAARKRMHAWLRDGIHDYAKLHDRLEGGTSELSPYLHLGCLSPRELEQRAGEAGSGQGPEEFVRQLCWRDFYAHVLLTNPANAHHAYRREMDELDWEDDDEAFDAWREGRTGFPVVDAAMRQLRERGWMHNRARLIAGSFLTKDLHIDWRRGEAHFMTLLVDGDEASNNGNWQWISSVGVDPAPYYRRMYNPAAQQERHDPDGAYVRRWVPELRDVPLAKLAEPWRMTEEEQEAAGCVIGRDYPEPIVDHKRERERAMARYREASGGSG